MGGRQFDPGKDNRVILLSDGVPTQGIVSRREIVAMARERLVEGVGPTTIGAGVGVDIGLMRELSEIGIGNFFFLENIAAAEEVFVEEIRTFITPIATNIRLEIEVGGAYGLRDVFGTRKWTNDGNLGVIEIDSLFVAHRQSHDDQDMGRRGGGGAIVAELLPVRGWQDLEGVEPGVVATLRLSYLPEGEMLLRTSETVVRYPYDPGELLEDGYFEAVGDESADSAEKAFVAMNVFVGFRMAAETAEAGNLDLALIGLEALETSVAAWLSLTHDEDIEDDLALIRLFINNLLRAGAGVEEEDPPDPPDPWPRD